MQFPGAWPDSPVCSFRVFYTECSALSIQASAASSVPRPNRELANEVIVGGIDSLNLAPGHGLSSVAAERLA